MRTLADRLDTADASFEALSALALARRGENVDHPAHPLIPWIAEAATGKVSDVLRDAPAAQRNPFKGHATAWFKSVEGGRELAEKVYRSGVWDTQLNALLRPFVDAVIRTQADPVPAAAPRQAQ
ncbi:hypothetical protein DO72_5164 [Burkholderia pseudomallei]|nr:hypothetical protein DO72_5164 [Burkholderia pseudomallei]